MPRNVLKVCGGWVVGCGSEWWWWLRPISVFTLSLEQSEEFLSYILEI